MTIKLACFDMDDTMINLHLHRLLAQAGIKPGEANSEIVRKLVEENGGVKNRMALQATLRDMLKKNIHIAVTSYTSYSESIPVVLKMIGLNDNEISQIKLASFTPPKGPNGEKTPDYGKNNHIQKAIEAFGEPVKPEEIVLIDDREDHYKLAKEKGYNVIWVQGSENDVGYLNELRQLAGLSVSQQAAPQLAPAAQTPVEQRWTDKILGWFGLQWKPAPEQPRPALGR